MKLGADVEAVDQLARAVTEESQRLGRSVQVVDNAIGTAWWQGPDADRFRTSWTGDLRARAQRAGDALDGMATELRRQADQQRRSSDDPAGGVGTGGASGTRSEFGLPPGVVVRDGTRTAFDGSAGVDATIGGHAGWDRSLTIEDGRFVGGLSAELFAGAMVTANASGSYGPLSATGSASVMTGAEGKVDATASLGRDGFHAHAGVEAFVGGKAEVKAKVDAGGLTTAGSASVSYGIGASLDADASLSTDKVGVEFELGATLGVGGEGRVELSVDPGEVADTVRDYGGDVIDFGGEIVDRISDLNPLD